MSWADLASVRHELTEIRERLLAEDEARTEQSAELDELNATLVVVERELADAERAFERNQADLFRERLRIEVLERCLVSVTTTMNALAVDDVDSVIERLPTVAEDCEALS